MLIKNSDFSQRTSINRQRIIHEHYRSYNLDVKTHDIHLLPINLIVSFRKTGKLIEIQ